jgi:AcrR family transcriptional regulator
MRAVALREVLLEHAAGLARAAGPDAVTLREVQRRAGVSHNAAYRHFAGRDALLGAVADVASTALADAMRGAIERAAPGGPPAARARARFRATGEGYLGFARAEPGLFRTAFAATATGSGLAQGPYAVLNACLDDLVATGTLDASRRAGTEAAVWASVHGLAMLLLDGPFAALDPAAQDRLVERLLDVVDAGVR